MLTTKEFFLGVLEKLEKYDFIFDPPDNFFKIFLKTENFNKLMKISQIKSGVINGSYDNDYWSFICDVSLSLKIVRDSQRQNSKAFKIVTTLQSQIDEELDTFMTDNGYCCGRHYVSKAKAVSCSGGSDERECTIKDRTRFYRYDRWTFCEAHLREKFGDEKLLKLNDHVIIHRNELFEYTFRAELNESFVRCERCQKLFHERCVLHLESSDALFLCHNCRPSHDIRFKRLSPRDIPQTECDKYILKFMRKNFTNYPPTLTIRMLSSEEIRFNTGKLLQTFSDNQSIPVEIGYKNISLFAFMEDPHYGNICFFAIYCQLYGSKTHYPNRNSAYISFLDSAKFYPKARRTELYQKLILGFLTYLRKCGVRKLFIWSCPPNEGVDYILPFKPRGQKTPNSEILDKWYESLIKLGKETIVRGKPIIKESPLIEQYAHDENWEYLQNIPLFEDDIWIIKLNEKIAEIEKEVQEQNLKFRTRNAIQHIDKKKALWDFIKAELQEKNKNYFVVLLGDVETTREPDDFEILERKWVNNRHLLIDFFCDKKLMFSDKRQASFATHCFLYRIILERNMCKACHQDFSPLNVSAKKRKRNHLLCRDCENIGEESSVVKKRITEDDFLKCELF